MRKYHLSFIALLALFSAALLTSVALSRRFAYPFPPYVSSPLPRYAAMDMAGIAFGARRLAADISWIQLLQYYGTPEHALDKETEFRLSMDTAKYLFGLRVTENEAGHGEHRYHPDYEGGVYPLLSPYSARTVELDPFFYYAYLYGASSLAWNLDRPDEAVALLQKGITVMERYRPNITQDIRQPYWQFHLYLSAIIYRKAGDTERMTGLLETAVRQPGCPNMVKTILANIYQKEKEPAKALRLWIDIYDSGDLMYRGKAFQKIEELRKALYL